MWALLTVGEVLGENPGLIRRDCVHPTLDGASLLSSSMVKLIRLPTW